MFKKKVTTKKTVKIEKPIEKEVEIKVEVPVKKYTDEQLANMDLADLAKELNKPYVAGATTLEDLIG